MDLRNQGRNILRGTKLVKCNAINVNCFKFRYLIIVKTTKMKLNNLYFIPGWVKQDNTLSSVNAASLV